MIPAIGMMIAAYTFARLLAMLLNPAAHVVARAVAFLAMIVVVLSAGGMLLSIPLGAGAGLH